VPQLLVGLCEKDELPMITRGILIALARLAAPAAAEPLSISGPTHVVDGTPSMWRAYAFA
jgi:hypothetical protein